MSSSFQLLSGIINSIIDDDHMELLDEEDQTFKLTDYILNDEIGADDDGMEPFSNLTENNLNDDIKANELDDDDMEPLSNLAEYILNDDIRPDALEQLNQHYINDFDDTLFEVRADKLSHQLEEVRLNNNFNHSLEILI